MKFPIFQEKAAAVQAALLELNAAARDELGFDMDLRFVQESLGLAVTSLLEAPDTISRSMFMQVSESLEERFNNVMKRLRGKADLLILAEDIQRDLETLLSTDGTKTKLEEIRLSPTFLYMARRYAILTGRRGGASMSPAKLKASSQNMIKINLDRAEARLKKQKLVQELARAKKPMKAMKRAKSPRG